MHKRCDVAAEARWRRRGEDVARLWRGVRSSRDAPRTADVFEIGLLRWVDAQTTGSSAHTALTAHAGDVTLTGVRQQQPWRCNAVRQDDVQPPALAASSATHAHRDSVMASLQEPTIEALPIAPTQPVVDAVDAAHAPREVAAETHEPGVERASSTRKRARMHARSWCVIRAVSSAWALVLRSASSRSIWRDALSFRPRALQPLDAFTHRSTSTRSCPAFTTASSRAASMSEQARCEPKTMASRCRAT